MELTIERVGKRYRGNVWGLRDFSLALAPGTVALLGPNGAGKSTLMHILATITRPTEGKVTWNGSDIVSCPNILRSELGYLPQDFGIYPNLNAVEFLEYMAALKGLPRRAASKRVGEVLDEVGILEVRKRPLGTYSGGMKQRVGIAQSLLNDPRLLIVDEPTAGLDPEERVRFRSLLSTLGGERIVLLSTHIVSDVAATATRVALIRRGRLLVDCTPEEMLRSVAGRVWEWVMPSTDLPGLKQKLLVSATVRQADGVRVRAIAGDRPHEAAAPAAPTLEDAYLYWITNDR